MINERRLAWAKLARRYVPATLVKKKEISPDTRSVGREASRAKLTRRRRVYTFKLPPKEDGSPGKLGLPIGKHVQVAFHAKNGVVLRPYTPIRYILTLCFVAIDHSHLAP